MTDIAPERSRVLAALEAVKDPKTGRGLVSAGLVQALVVQPGRAGFMMEVEAGEGPLYAPVRGLAEQALGAGPGRDRAPGGGAGRWGGGGGGGRPRPAPGAAWWPRGPGGGPPAPPAPRWC